MASTMLTSPSHLAVAKILCSINCRANIFFAIFKHHPTWNWNKLPREYLQKPDLTLDITVEEPSKPLPYSNNDSEAVMNMNPMDSSDNLELKDIPRRQVSLNKL